jgi:L-threonylcarbamoyladenylate synthase
MPAALDIKGKLKEQIEEAAELLKKGGVVAFPTDTVYGLGASPFCQEAVDRIYEIKQRLRHLPFPILLEDEAQLSEVVDSVPGIARLLIKQFWPGGLTLVLPKKSSFPGVGTRNEKNIAVRVPAHDIAITLIRMAGVPVIGTSANISKLPSALTAREVEAQLGSVVDMIIDGGKCPGGVESTVIDITGSAPLILRRGAVPESEIIRICQEYLKGVDKDAHSFRV